MAVVDGLGKEGDVVTVADGYARNYLMPRELAAPVSEGTRRRLAKLQVERDKEQAESLAEAQALAKKVGAASCTITVKVGEGEQLYGSVGESDIADALKTQGIEIDRHQVALTDHIKELGTFDVPVRLHPQVEATLKVWVVEE
ncbi:MAG: 50S ribosomal protein L9 [Kiritimatiellae bacterium]|nr:50S ribosomal protein L9 [Kiritimatiellia bacterium]